MGTSPAKKSVIIGTRRSRLALWQAEYVKRLLEQSHSGIEVALEKIVTSGDRTQEAGTPLPEIGGKGLFTAELESALAAGTIDLAVHSLKDLPTKMEPDFIIGAIPPRASPAEVLVARSNFTFADLPPGAVIGTSSIRRASQLLRLRPDLQMKPIRGNVETRIAKVQDGAHGYDATVLARAGLDRLERGDAVCYQFSMEELLPAPGQGALAIQCRSNDERLRELLVPLHDYRAACETAAERAFLAALGGGYNAPVACLAKSGSDRLTLLGRCLARDGSRTIEVRGEAALGDAFALGLRMGDEALARGAADLL